MRLENLVFNRIGNSFSALFSSPSFQIMDNVQSLVDLHGKKYYYQILGVSCIEQDNIIFKIQLNFNNDNIFLKFKSDGKIVLEYKNKVFDISYYEDHFRLFIEDFNLIILFSNFIGKYINFEKNQSYFVKLPTEELFIKGIIEFLLVLEEYFEN